MTAGRWGPVRILTRTFTAAFALLGLLLVLVTFTPMVSWWAARLAGPWADPGGDILIVLGGSALTDGILGESSYWRSVYAVRAYREGHFREVIVSGGGPPPPIADTMREFLVCQGIPARVIRTESLLRNTQENAIFVREMLSSTPGTKVLMTSDYHMGVISPKGRSAERSSSSPCRWCSSR